MKTCLKSVAIIMDGNGRWAKNRSRPRFWGHIQGSRVVDDIIIAADEAGVEELTLYAFSTENFSRPEKEIQILYKLLKKYLLKEKQRILTNRIRFRVIGEYSKLPIQTQQLVEELQDLTCNNSGLKLNFAFGYGGKQELLNCMNDLHGLETVEMQDVENWFSKTSLSKVDLLIRTGGDFRISNFLLWQLSYAELYFTKTLWPDFNAQEFVQIIQEVETRERRFGGISSALFDKDSKHELNR